MKSLSYNTRVFLVISTMMMGAGATLASASPTWEKKWYPVVDGAQNKIFVRFGTENGKRYRQWGNGYDRKVKFRGRIIYSGVGPGQPNPDRTFTDQDVIPLEAGAMTRESLLLPMQNEPLVDIRAEIIE